jgi:hypothetical protein
VDWLERAFPVPSIRLLPMRVEDYGQGSVPTCDDANALLYLKAAWDNVYDADVEFGKTRYYAMVDDVGGFMRGCSANRPGFVASGPTGTPGSGSWDTDGSYGDWYGAHELGHSYGRRHTRGEVPLVGPGDCGDERGPDPSYPYWEGYISGDSDGDSALFGFDIRSQAIYGPRWRDVMSYCDNLWISDYTYEKLMNFFQNNLGRSAVSRPSAPADRLLVVGTIDPETNSADLQPLFVVPNAEALDPRLPGDYAIVLHNEAGSELAQYPFTPAAIHSGPAVLEGPWQGDIALMAINEMVPYVDGTTQVEVEGPDGSVLTSVSAGASAPTVTLTAPNGGETIVGDTTTVTWTASDPDGDSLHFDLQYSDDNGTNWQMVSQNLSGNSVELSTDNLTGADQGLFRIWVSDGIHTTSDESDGTFAVPNRDPELEILAPGEGTIIAADQTLNLQGRAYDGDTGLMPDDQIRWISNQDGILGFGPQLSVTDLSLGQHIISFFADDNNGGFALETVQITVVANLSLVPAQADALDVGPTTIVLEPKDGVNSAQFSVDNHIHTNPITWQATADQPWLQLSATSGTTPGNVTVTFQETGLDSGSHVATITVTSSDVPGQSIDVSVVTTIPGQAVYLPAVTK